MAPKSVPVVHSELEDSISDGGFFNGFVGVSGDEDDSHKRVEIIMEVVAREGSMEIRRDEDEEVVRLELLGNAAIGASRRDVDISILGAKRRVDLSFDQAVDATKGKTCQEDNSCGNKE